MLDTISLTVHIFSRIWSERITYTCNNECIRCRHLVAFFNLYCDKVFRFNFIADGRAGVYVSGTILCVSE